MTQERPRIAIDTTYMDRRPGKGTAIVIRHSIEELRRYKDEFDITLIHRTPVPEDPLYREFRELIIPRVLLPRWSGFMSEALFFLTTKERFDLYYFSYSRLYPTFWLAPARRIAFAIMDGGPATARYFEKIKGPQPWWVRMFFERVNAFIALSQFGRDGAIRQYGLPADRVHVVYNGVDERFFAPAQDDNATLDRYGLPHAYLLCVSRFDPHKNILRLLEAYRQCVDAHPATEPLVFVGGRHLPDYSKKVDTAIDALNLQDRVVVAPFIDDQDLPAVYRQASLMVFPSLYEGFGLPAIEALAAGTPLVVSDSDSLREVTGGHAEFVNPYDSSSIAAGIIRARTAPSERRVAGTAFARTFSWKSHGDALAAVFRSVLHYE